MNLTGAHTAGGACSTWPPGCFARSPAHPHYLPPAEAEAAFSLSRMTPANCHRFRLSRLDRNTILDRLLSYYRLHFPTLPAITSTDILHQLFS